MPNPILPIPFPRVLPWVTFMALLFTTIYASRSILAPLLVPIEQSLQIGHTQSTSLFLIQYIGFSISLFLCGFLLSKITPAHMAALSIICTGLCLCLMSYATTLNETRFTFFLIGISGGAYFPAGMAILSTLVYPKDWGKAMGIHELAPTITFIIIPLLAVTLLKTTTWQGVCIYIGVFITIIGFCFLLIGKGGKSCIDIPSFAGCKKIIHDPASWAFAVLLTISMTGEFAIFSTLQLYLTNTIYLTPQLANTVTSYSRLFTPIAVLIGGWASDRFNPYTTIKISLIIHALALILMSIDSVSIVIVGMTIQPSVIAFLFPIVFKVFALRFPIHQQPIILSLFMPIAGLCSNGCIPLFIGYCGEFLTFKFGFLSIALFSIASIWAIHFLKKYPSTEY